MNKEGIKFKILFGILFIIITLTTIPIVINNNSILAQQEQGITPTDPKNITNQTLQGIPTEDKDMSSGLGNNQTNYHTQLSFYFISLNFKNFIIYQ